jgi:hypothetical protein
MSKEPAKGLLYPGIDIVSSFSPSKNNLRFFSHLPRKQEYREPQDKN